MVKQFKCWKKIHEGMESPAWFNIVYEKKIPQKSNAANEIIKATDKKSPSQTSLLTIFALLTIFSYPFFY